MSSGNLQNNKFSWFSAAQRLSGVALALDLCSLFGEKIHSRYIQATLESSLLSKELLGMGNFGLIGMLKFQTFCRVATKARGAEAQAGACQTQVPDVRPIAEEWRCTEWHGRRPPPPSSSGTSWREWCRSREWNTGIEENPSGLVMTMAMAHSMIPTVDKVSSPNSSQMNVA